MSKLGGRQIALTGAALLAIAGCGSSTASTLGASGQTEATYTPTSVSSFTPPVQTVPVPTINPRPVGTLPPGADSPSMNWEKPIAGGPVVKDATAAKQVGELPYEPVTPDLGVTPSLIQVDPGGFKSVVFVYHLPEAGTINVLESKLGSNTEEGVLAPARRNSPYFKLVDLGGGKQGLLVQNEDGSIGRVMWVEDEVIYDITGPKVTPEQTTKLAQKVLAQS